MADVIFEDYSIEVKNAMSNLISAALEEAAGELESEVKRNTRVKTGQTKNSFRHIVAEEEQTAYIGSDQENAIWEEFGTGEHALEGNGRQGGWVYVDEQGEGHFTRGKKPSRAFHKAYTSKKEACKTLIQNKLKEL